MKEIWKKIVELPFYEISNLGRLRREFKKPKLSYKAGAYCPKLRNRYLGRFKKYDDAYNAYALAYQNHYGFWPHEKVLRTFPNKTGYVMTVLHVNKADKAAIIHQLVAQYHIGPRPEGQEVHHRDGNKANNRVDNLEYLPRSEVIEKSLKLGLFKKKRSFSEIQEIRKLYKKGVSYHKLAKQFRTSNAYISRVCRLRIRRQS